MCVCVCVCVYIYMNFFSMRKLRLREISKSLQSDGRKWLDQHLHPELSGPRVCTCIVQYGSQQMCGGLVVKNLPANSGGLRDAGSTPGLGRSPGEGNGNSLQYSCLEYPHGQRSLAGNSPWGHRESERLSD